MPFTLSLSPLSPRSKKSGAFWSDHGGWCQQASLQLHMIRARASGFPRACLQRCWLWCCKWCKEETNQNHSSAPLWGKTCVTKTHTHTHTLQQWKWYLDTAGCSRSVLRALEDWLVVQQTSRQKISRRGESHVTVCVWMCVSRGMQGNVCIYPHWNLIQMSNVNSGLPVSWHRRFPARLSSAWGSHLQTFCCALSFINFFFAWLLQWKSLFLTGSLSLGKKERVPRGAAETTVTANLEARPSRVPNLHWKLNGLVRCKHVVGGRKKSAFKGGEN